VRKADLTWYRVTFPRDVSADGVLAALTSLSGAPHSARVVFDLEATDDGITHRLAITPAHEDILLAALRAAIPSLRVDRTGPPDSPTTVRLLWQLSPARAAIRSDEPAASAAGLLSGLYPLTKGESVRLSWTMRPHPQPPQRSNARTPKESQPALTAKAKLPVVKAVGELFVQAAPSRVRQLVQRVSAPLWSLRTQHGRLVADPPLWGQAGFRLGLRGRHFNVAELAAVIGWPVDGPDLPGLELGAAKRVIPSTAVATEGRVLGNSDVAGVDRTVALSPTASTRGLYVLGPTGTGKTSLLKNLIRDDLTQGRGLAVVETNGDLIRDLLDLIPPERTGDVVLLDATDPTHAVGFNPFAGSSNTSLVADQIGELFQRLWQAYWGPRTAQLAHMGLLTLAERKGSTLLDLPRLFLDERFRAGVLHRLNDPVGLEPDWRWFQALAVREQANVVAPLLNKVRQFTARSSIRSIVGQAEPAVSMRKVMAERKILLVNLPKGLVGADTATLLGCLVLTSLWQAATERAALPNDQRHPFGLYVDEVQDFAAAPIPWDEMFAQGRKYGLALTVAHQNLDQLPRDLREVVLANARSKAVFSLSATDAKKVEPLFAPALTAADLQALDAYSIAALLALDDGSVSRPVTLNTPPTLKAVGSAEAVRRSSRQRYSRPRQDVENDLRQAARPQAQTTAPVGRKRKGAP
jgi:hypothetical protein